MSSYALILMIVYLIQTKEMQNIANPGATQNLGSLLISFLQTYGFEYDYYNQFLVNPRKIMKQTEAGPDMYFENMSLMNIVHQNPVILMRNYAQSNPQLAFDNGTKDYYSRSFVINE